MFPRDDILKTFWSIRLNDFSKENAEYVVIVSLFLICQTQSATFFDILEDKLCRALCVAFPSIYLRLTHDRYRETCVINVRVSRARASRVKQKADLISTRARAPFLKAEANLRDRGRSESRRPYRCFHVANVSCRYGKHAIISQTRTEIGRHYQDFWSAADKSRGLTLRQGNRQDCYFIKYR